MEKNRGLKLSIAVGICLCVTGLAIGFANFSSLLNISSIASVNTSVGNFKVEFSSVLDETLIGNVTVISNPSGLNVNAATINNSGQNPIISNLGATFTSPGQSVTYTFYTRNVGEFVAFLNSITLTGEKNCTAINGTNEDVKNTLCEGLEISVSVGEGDKKITIPSGGTYGTEISNHSLGVSESEKVVVTITYNPTSSLIGDISATFGTIGLNYNGVD